MQKTKISLQLLAILLTMVMIFTVLPTFAAVDGDDGYLYLIEVVDALEALTTENSATGVDWESSMERALERIVTVVAAPNFGSVGGEWAILALARSGFDIPDGWFEGYLERIGAHLDSLNETADPNTAGANWVLNPVNGRREARLANAQSTENARLIVALTALGVDASNFTSPVSGYTYDLVARLGNRHNATSNNMFGENQGINGPAWNLIALNSRGFDTPYGISDRTWVGGTTQANPITLAERINWILNNERNPAGWSLSGGPDPDITSMVIQALAPYYGEHVQVTAAIDRALGWLSTSQNATGGWASWGTYNVQSTAQVIVALTKLGIDPTADARFIKNGNTPIDSLVSFQDEATGGFIHGGSINLMATEQAAYALVAYWRFRNNLNSLYDMSDAFPEMITVYMTLEGFTLGHGFYIEPIQITVPAGSTVIVPTLEMLAANGLTHTAAGGWITRIFGLNYGEINVPEFIMTPLPGSGSAWTGNGSGNGSLGSADYATWSGWMYTVNHEHCDDGAAVRELQNGDVIRWQFSLAAGPDLGAVGSWAPNFFEQEDKTRLIRALFAENADVSAKPNAFDVISNPIATAVQVANAIAKLEGAPIISVSNIESNAGGEVTVDISIVNNSGFASLPIRVDFPAELTLTEFELGADFADTFMSAGPADTGFEPNMTIEVSSRFVIKWVNAYDITADGVLVSLTFDIAENAVRGSEFDIEISFATYSGGAELPANAAGVFWNSFVIENGAVRIPSLILGDVTGDGIVDILDAMRLAQWLAGWDVEIDKEASMVTAFSIQRGVPGSVDVLRILRYAAGHDVTFGD